MQFKCSIRLTDLTDQVIHVVQNCVIECKRKLYYGAQKIAAPLSPTHTLSRELVNLLPRKNKMMKRQSELDCRRLHHLPCTFTILGPHLQSKHNHQARSPEASDYRPFS